MKGETLKLIKPTLAEKNLDDRQIEEEVIKSKKNHRFESDIHSKRPIFLCVGRVRAFLFVKNHLHIYGKQDHNALMSFDIIIILLTPLKL